MFGECFRVEKVPGRFAQFIQGLGHFAAAEGDDLAAGLVTKAADALGAVTGQQPLNQRRKGHFPFADDDVVEDRVFPLGALRQEAAVKPAEHRPGVGKLGLDSLRHDGGAVDHVGHGADADDARAKPNDPFHRFVHAQARQARVHRCRRDARVFFQVGPDIADADGRKIGLVPLFADVFGGRLNQHDVVMVFFKSHGYFRHLCWGGSTIQYVGMEVNTTNPKKSLKAEIAA